MTLKPGMITLDTADAVGIGRWWAQQTGGEVIEENDGWFVVVALPDGLRLGFQKVDDPTPGKNRVHIDFVAEDLDASVDELRSAGAGHVGDREMPGFRWVTLTDPDGNQFCVSGTH